MQNLYSLLQSSHTCDLEVPGAATCYIYTMWTLTSSTKHKICNVASYIVFSFFPKCLGETYLFASGGGGGVGIK